MSMVTVDLATGRVSGLSACGRTHKDERQRPRPERFRVRDVVDAVLRELDGQLDQLGQRPQAWRG